MPARIEVWRHLKTVFIAQQVAPQRSRHIYRPHVICNRIPHNQWRHYRKSCRLYRQTLATYRDGKPCGIWNSTNQNVKLSALLGPRNLNPQGMYFMNKFNRQLRVLSVILVFLSHQKLVLEYPYRQDCS